MDTAVNHDQWTLTLSAQEVRELRSALDVARNVLVTLKARAEMQTTSACFEKLDRALSASATSPGRPMRDHA